MAITPRLEIKQSQSLLMTPQLRQAIGLLQLSNLELNELINQELEINPFLEREEDLLGDVEERKEQTIDNYDDEKKTTEEEIKLDIDYDNEFDDFASDREGYDEPSDYAWEDYSKPKTAEADENYDYFEQKLQNEKSLYKMLSEQIQIHFSKNYNKIIATHLVEHLDMAGYFRGDCFEIAQRLKIGEEAVNKVLKKMKTFEPSGIFASSLSECLLVQMKDLNLLTEQSEKVLNNLELLANGNIKELKKKCDIDDDETLHSIVKNIKSLNPKPIADFSNDTTTYIIPDVFVKRGKYGQYYIELNNMSLPRVLINNQYFSKVLANETKEKSANRFIKNQMNNASFLIKSLNQRANTILKVSEEIVKNQYDFLENGIKHLKPMLLKDISEAIEMHESTVSRVTNNKYIHTPRGVFELKYFFSSAVNTFNGDTNTSTTSIKHLIKQLIDNEDKNQVLADDQISEILAQKGIKTARRTVAKYREAMNIPTSATRKRINRAKI